jgi:predicted nucleic acid-binding protein
MKIVVDSDVIIDVIRNVQTSLDLLKELVKENELFISGITEAEIFSGRDLQDENKKQKLLRFLSFFQKVNPNNEILQKAGEFRRKYNISLLDCIIAATAYCINAELLTRNEKDFSKIEEIKLFKK